METRDIVRVNESEPVAACNGGGALGHPLVYLTFEGKHATYVDCYYCSRRFVKPGYREEVAAPPA